MLGSLSEKNPTVQNLLASFSGVGPGAYLTHQDSIIFKVIAKTPILRLF